MSISPIHAQSSESSLSSSLTLSSNPTTSNHGFLQPSSSSSQHIVASSSSGSFPISVSDHSASISDAAVSSPPDAGGFSKK
ncbi:hypothetical protein FRX31_003204, partial [Thalictrum thalictroides]